MTRPHVLAPLTGLLLAGTVATASPGTTSAMQT